MTRGRVGNYYLYRIGSFLTRRVPLPMAYAVGVFLADCHYLFSRADRKSVEANLRVILNAAPSRAMVREVFQNFGKYLVDFFTMTKHVNDDFVKKHVEVSGIEYLNQVLKEGKGGIIISAHTGNWEMAAAILSLLEYPLSVVALPHKDPRVNKFFNDQRGFFGTTVIPTTTALRRCLEHLSNNRLLAILADRDFGQKGMVMDFLGKPTMIPKGPAIFSLRTGAPIVSCFFMRRPDNGFEVVFGPPIYPPATGGKIGDEELGPLITKYMQFVQQKIRQYPTQWLMFREFWIP